MKKLLAALLAALMSVSLAACSSGSAQPQNDTAAQPNASTTPAPAGDKKKITAWAWDQAFNVAALQDAKALYEASHPDVEVEIVEIGQADIIQKLNTGLSSGSTEGMPNLIPMEDYRIRTFLMSYPDAFVEMTDQINYDDFAAYKKEAMTVEGKSYGIPWDSGATVLYYRKDLIEQAGYTEADMNDLTWAKYIEIGKAVKEKCDVYMLPLNPNDIGELRIMLQSAGKWYVGEDGNRPDFADNQVLKEAIKTYKTIFDEGLARPITGWSDLLESMNGGLAASVFTGCWFTPSITAEPSQTGQWRIAPIPRFDNLPTATNASNLGGGSWYVLNVEQGNDIAVDFLVSTFGKDSNLYAELLKNRGIVSTYLPVQSSDIYHSEVEYFGGQKIYDLIAQQTVSIPRVNYGMYTYAFDDLLKAEMQNILKGEDVDKALQNVQAQAEHIASVG